MKRIRKTIPIAAGAFIMIALSAVFGYFLGSQLMTFSDQHAQYPFALLLGLELLILLVMLNVGLIIHEGGHLIAGLCSGYSFVSFRIGSLTLIKDEHGKIRQKRFTLAGTAGQCLLDPPDVPDEDVPYVFYNLGGVIFNLLLTGIMGLLYPLFDGTFTGLVLAMGVLANLAIALTNGIPLKTQLVTNDGYNAMHLGMDENALHAFVVSLRINAAQQNGLRLKEMNPEWFKVPEDSDLNNAMTSTLTVLYENLLMDQGRYEQAAALIDHLEMTENCIPGIYLSLLTCDRMICAALTDENREIYSHYESREEKSLRKPLRDMPAVMAAEYIAALAISSDARRAEKYLKQFEAAEAKYPFAGEIEYLKELMALADEKYLNH